MDENHLGYRVPVLKLSHATDDAEAIPVQEKEKSAVVEKEVSEIKRVPEEKEPQKQEEETDGLKGGTINLDVDMIKEVPQKETPPKIDTLEKKETHKLPHSPIVFPPQQSEEKPDMTPPVSSRVHPYAMHSPEVIHTRDEKDIFPHQKVSVSVDTEAKTFTHTLLDEEPTPVLEKREVITTKNSNSQQEFAIKENPLPVPSEKKDVPALGVIGETDLPDMWEGARAHEKSSVIDEGVVGEKQEGKNTLNALRERILHKKEASTPPSTQTIPREKESPAITPEQFRSTMAEKTVSSIQKGVENPKTRHAQAIADIAHTLKVLKENENAYDLTRKDIVQYRRAYATATPVEESREVVKPTIPRVRTFKNDMAQMALKQKTSLTGMIALNEERKEISSFFKEPPAPEKKSLSIRILPIVGALLFLGGISIFGMYFFLQRPVVVNIPTSTLVQFDLTQELKMQEESGDSFARRLVRTAKDAPASREALVRVTPFKENTATSTGKNTKQEITARAFLIALGYSVPRGFTDAFEDEFAFGGYRGKKDGVFFVLRTKEYERIFAGMLFWEATMPQDLRILFDFFEMPTPSILVEGKNASSSNSVETRPNEMVVSLPTDTKTISLFSDVTVRNVRTRGIRTKEGITPLWAMPDNSTLIVASDEETFLAVLDHLKVK